MPSLGDTPLSFHKAFNKRKVQHLEPRAGSYPAPKPAQGVSCFPQISFQPQTVSWSCILPNSLLPTLQAAEIITMSLAVPKHLPWQWEEAASQPSVHLASRPLTQVSREEAYYLARESPGGFTPTLSSFKGTGKSWDMFPGTPLMLVQQLRAPPYPPRAPTSCRPAQGPGAAEASLGKPATLIPAHFHLSPPASLLPSLPA